MHLEVDRHINKKLLKLKERLFPFMLYIHLDKERKDKKKIRCVLEFY